MQSEERERLERRLRSVGRMPRPLARSMLVLTGTFLAGLFLVGLPLVFLSDLPFGEQNARVLMLSPAFVTMIIVGGTLLRGPWLRGLEQRSLLRADLEEDEVELRPCLLRDAWLVSSGGDSPGLFLQLSEDETLLYLGGDYIPELLWGASWAEDEFREDAEREEQGSFPCTTFELVLALHSRAVLGVECKGEHVAPTRRIDLAELDAPLPEDGQVFHGALETLREDLLYHATS